MSDVLGVAWRTVAFGWRFGSALVTAAIASVVGVLVGFVGFVVPMRLPPHAQVLLRPGQPPPSSASSGTTPMPSSPDWRWMTVGIGHTVLDPFYERA